MSEDIRYAAFISYAHADELVAARLHKALETYPVPKSVKLMGQGQLSPIFRDAAELTAHHSLSEKIREAVEGSRFLIVLCSSAAKKSHWVNEEIRLFREVHGEGSILCVLSEGNPATSFPPALLEAGREPLAANLGTTREGFRLGVTQLAASMLGVELDQLIQRDGKRRRNRARLLTAGSMVFATLMGGMAWTAVNARDAAEVSRTEAENMVEFMLTDLKQDLEPVGRLNILDDVGNRVTDYYDAIPLADMDDDRLSRQARARHLLGQVAIDQGKIEKAKAEIEAAYKATKEVMRRNPNKTDAIYAHAQSAYWVGAIEFNSNNLEKMKNPLFEYNELAQKLYKLDSKNFDWVMEAAWGQSNLGSWARKFYTKPKTQDSVDYYSQAVNFFKEALTIKPESKLAKYELSGVLAGRASSELAFGTAEQSRAFKVEGLEYLNQLTENYPDDKKLRLQKLGAELDYHHDFFLELSKAQEEKVKDLLGQLYELTLHDPENLSYKISFLDYSFEYLIKNDLPSNSFLLPKIQTLISDLPNEISGKAYYQAMLDLVEMKRDNVEGLDLKNTVEEKRWKLDYIYLLRKKSPQAAQNFLSVIKNSSDLPHPTMLDKKIRAHKLLKNCSYVSLYLKALHSRGFTQTTMPHIKECRVSD